MTRVGKTSTPPRELPFKYLSGDPSLDLVNTVDWTRQGSANERLTNYERATRWAEGAGLVPGEDRKQLRIIARAQPRAAQVAVERTRRLRATLQQLYGALAAGTSQRGTWEEFNKELAEALQQLRVGPQSPRHKGSLAGWKWHRSKGRLDAFLWPVVWSAARLLTSDEAQRIRVCGGTDCGWMYVDRSRNGLRRWCAMETCGTLKKTQRRRERNRRATR